MHDNLLYNANGPLRIRWGGTYGSIAAFKAGTGEGSGSIEANPLFVAAGSDDFHLAAASPAIDQGASFSGYANLFKSRYGLDINVDLDGAARVHGAGVDMGALETGSGSPTEPNNAPTAADKAVVIDEDKTASGALTGDDEDGDAISFQMVSAASHGSATVNADGSFTYAPDADWHGTDTFAFCTNDGWYDSNPATVTVTVRSVNDAPIAGDVQLNALRETTVSGTIAASDADGDPLRFTLGAPASHGTAGVAADGTFTYTPAAGFGGTDAFAVKISDGTAATTATVTILVGSPVLSVDTTALDFGYTTDSRDFTVQNTGEALLEYSVACSEAWLTAAPASGDSTGEADTLTLNVDRSALAAGSHTATVTIDAGVGGSQEIQVRLDVPAVTTVTLIDVDDTWAYRTGASAPAAEWNEADFDDSSWATGPAAIGYSDDVTYPTELDDMRYNYNSFFARKTFNVDDPAAVLALELGIVYDDGFIAYINGVEVARSESMGGTAGSPVAYDAATVVMHDAFEDEETFALQIPTGLLTAGANTLAIEVHNIVETSSDAVMIPHLVATTADLPGPAETADLNADGRIDLADIDLLAAAVRDRIVDDRYDLNRDGTVSGGDVEYLVCDILGTEIGDTNLDGRVDLIDFVQLKQNIGETDASWSDGDLDCDGVVSLTDVVVLKSAFGFKATSASIRVGSDQLAGDTVGVFDALARAVVTGPRL